MAYMYFVYCNFCSKFILKLIDNRIKKKKKKKMLKTVKIFLNYSLIICSFLTEYKKLVTTTTKKIKKKERKFYELGKIFNFLL